MVDNLVNFEKLRMIAKEVRTLTNMCSVPLDLFSMLELGGQQPSSAMVSMNQLTTGQHLARGQGRTGRKKTAGIPNPKRMFEEAQMVRRVKAYLKSMKIITDEDALHKMSMECEPPLGGLPPPLNTVRKRNPSPTPSLASSASSSPSQYSQDPPSPDKRGLATAPNKFGAASPQAVKKLLSLSEQSRPRQKSHLAGDANKEATKDTATRENSEQLQQQQPVNTPVNLTKESSSVSGRPRSKGHQSNGCSSASRNRSQSPQLPVTRQRRHQQQYHRHP